MTLFLSLVAAGRAAEINSPGLPRSTPEAQGISSAAILDFVTSADRQVDAMNSFMLVRHGSVVAEGWWSPYAANTPHSMFSLSKSFTSTAVGLAISDGKLSLDDDFAEQPVAASGAWTADGTYTVKLSFYETPFRLTLALRFTGDKLFYDCEYNVGFGPTMQPQLAGAPR